MITATTDQLAHAQRFLGAIPGAAERAMAKAMNAAIKGARLEALDKIADRYEVDGADVRARLTTQLARVSSLSAVLKAKSPGLPLTYFPHDPDQPGTGGRGKPPLSATVLRGQTKPVRGAFVAKLGTKARVVERLGHKTSTGKDALRVIPSVPIAVMLGVQNVALAVEERALQLLDENLSREIDRELEAAK